MDGYVNIDIYCSMFVYPLREEKVKPFGIVTFRIP